MNKKVGLININITESAISEKEDLLDKNNIGMIYGHKCIITEKWYIGQTIKKPISRWGLNGQRYLERYKDGEKKGLFKHIKFAPAIEKYGWENFEHYILGYYKIDELDDKEKFWIHEKNSYNDGYNSTDGSEPKNRKKERYFKNTNSKNRPIMSEEVREHLRIINTGKKHSEETKRKMSESRKGQKIAPFTEEHRRKISEANKLKVGSLNSFYGKKHSDETKEKIRKKNSKPVAQIDPITGTIIKVFSSPTEAAKEVGLSNCSTISHCCNGSQKTTAGFKWSYIF